MWVVLWFKSILCITMVNLILGVGLQWQIYKVGVIEESNCVFRPKFLLFFSFIWHSISFHLTSFYKQTHEPRLLIPERRWALDPNGDKLLAYKYNVKMIPCCRHLCAYGHWNPIYPVQSPPTDDVSIATNFITILEFFYDKKANDLSNLVQQRDAHGG